MRVNVEMIMESDAFAAMAIWRACFYRIKLSYRIAEMLETPRIEALRAEMIAAAIPSTEGGLGRPGSIGTEADMMLPERVRYRLPSVGRSGCPPRPGRLHSMVVQDIASRTVNKTSQNAGAQSSRAARGTPGGKPDDTPGGGAHNGPFVRAAREAIHILTYMLEFTGSRDQLR